MGPKIYYWKIGSQGKVGGSKLQQGMGGGGNEKYEKGKVNENLLAILQASQCLSHLQRERCQGLEGYSSSHSPAT